MQWGRDYETFDKTYILSQLQGFKVWSKKHKVLDACSDEKLWLAFDDLCG